MNATNCVSRDIKRHLSTGVVFTIWVCFMSLWPAFPTNAEACCVQIAELTYTNITDVSWNPDGTRLAVVDFPSIHILDSATWELILTIPDAGVSHVEWNSDGEKIASVAGGNPSSLYIWDSETGDSLQHLIVEYSDVIGGVFPMYQLAWSPDERTIVSDSYATSILRDHLESGKLI